MMLKQESSSGWKKMDWQKACIFCNLKWKELPFPVKSKFSINDWVNYIILPAYREDDVFIGQYINASFQFRCKFNYIFKKSRISLPGLLISMY